MPNKKSAQNQTSPRLQPLGAVLAASLGIVVVLGTKSYGFWEAYIASRSAAAWDGSAHFAILKLYDATAFPAVFGWTGSFFAGMPFPNFYPPLWFWMSAALHHLGFSLILSAKLLLLISVVLLPSALGLLASRLTSIQLVGPIGAFLGFVPLVSEFMKPDFAGGLTLASTFNSGIYTEPLSFLLLLLALGVLYGERRKAYTFLLPAVLFAGVLLSNLFVAIAAAPMLLGFIVAPRLEWARTKRAALIAALSLALTAFWWTPVVKGYWTVVTLPLHPSLGKMISGGMAVWLVVGLVCLGFCAWHGSEHLKRYCWGVTALCLGTLLSYLPGLESFPLQLPRFVEIIVFLLAVPMSVVAEKGVSRVFVWLRGAAALPTPLWRQAAYLFAGGAFMGLALTPMKVDTSLYSPERALDLQPVLDFGRSHQDGRYLVQVPHIYQDRYSARALDAYLGAQGNEVAFIAYRESSTGSLFYEPLHEMISGLTSSFGISSSLDGDPDLLREPVERSLRRLEYMGIRYIVRRPGDKFRSPVLAKASLVLSAPWEIYELPWPEQPREERLGFLPALVIGNISYKQRHSGQIEMNRLLEEQFRAADFDVNIVHAGSSANDLPPSSDGFGALIVTDYVHRKGTALFNLVRDFPADRPVFLFPKPSPVYAKLAQLAKSRPNVHVLDTSDIEEGEWLGDGSHGTSNLHAIEGLWAEIASILRAHRSPVSAECLTGGKGYCPTLIHYSYDAWWHTADDSQLYVGGPAAIMVFGSSANPLTHRKSTIELVATGVSLASFVVVCLLALASFRTGVGRPSARQT